MPLSLVTTKDERLVCPEAAGLLRASLARGGRATLLVPSFAQALDAQRELAAAGGLSLGVTVTTPVAWAQERWEVWGDGRRLVDDASRDVLARRVLSRAAARPGSSLRDTPGTAALLADLARAGLPWLVGAPAPDGVTEAERELVGLLSNYDAELVSAGLVETCEVMSGLPRILADAGAAGDIVCAGFDEMDRALCDMLSGLARTCDVSVVLATGESPAYARSQALLEELGSRGGSVRAVGEGEAPVPMERSAELNELLGTIFSPVSEPVTPTGAVRLLLPAGPSAEPELVAREVTSLAASGVRDVVLVAPDPARAWRELSARLIARGASVRAQLSVPLSSLECGRAYLEFVETVALLDDLSRTWPEATPVPEAPRAGTVRVTLADMSWWPPRPLSDFLVSRISHLDAARARELDRQWRGNRLLTPPAVLDCLQSERDVSREVAAATRELLRGRLGSAASKLLSSFVQGEGVDAPEAAEAAGVLSTVLGVAKSLKELGLTADPSEDGHVTLAELVGVARDVLSRSRVPLRLELGPQGRPCCRVRLVDARTAARMAPCSADALVLLGQTSTESAVDAPDDVRSALLEAYGVEAAPSAMDAARAQFAAALRVPRKTLVVERALFGADGKPCYPSVMLVELQACYGIEADAKARDIRGVLGEKNVLGRSEAPVGENVSASGLGPVSDGRETPSPAGVIDASERACVSPPLEGFSAEDSRPILSASQIESYLECPYKWFSLRRLRLQDSDAGFTGAEMGTFAHRVLELARTETLARAVERELGTSELADMRAADSRAMWARPYAARVEELVGHAQTSPTMRLAGSAIDDLTALEETREVLLGEFEEHLVHQYQLEKGVRPQMQALVAHSAQQMGRVAGLRGDLSSLLDFELQALMGFEPRFFEWRFGGKDDVVEYGGVRITGTVDRIDVDSHGQAVVIDYKHKPDAGFAREYDALPKGGGDGSFSMPRRVQSLIYGQIVRRAFPDLKVRGAVYLCTRGSHAIAGAVDENVVDNVFGSNPLTNQRRARVSVPRAQSYGRDDEAGFEALLDACEEAVGKAVGRLLAGDIEANPIDAEACSFCPVLNCERRLRK